MGHRTENGRVKVLVNKESILEYPTTSIDERIVECSATLPFGRTIYVHKALLDKQTRSVRIMDFALLEEPKLQVELSNEELNIIKSLDSTPSDLMEFIYGDEEEEDDEDEDEISDSENEESD